MPGAALRRLLTAAEVDAAISASPRILAHGMAKAQKVQRLWADGVPEFDPGRSRRGAPPRGKPGDAKASIRITVIHRRGRVAWRIGSDNFLVRMMEFGSQHMPKLAPRDKAARAARGI